MDHSRVKIERCSSRQVQTESTKKWSLTVPQTGLTGWHILNSLQVINYLILNGEKSMLHLLISLAHFITMSTTHFSLFLTCILNLFERKCMRGYVCTVSPQQRLLANRSPRYSLMRWVRLQPEESFCFQMTLTLPLVGVGLQSKHVHLDQVLLAGGVITWGELQTLNRIQLTKFKDTVAAVLTDCIKHHIVFVCYFCLFVSGLQILHLFFYCCNQNCHILQLVQRQPVFQCLQQWWACQNRATAMSCVSFKRWQLQLHFKTVVKGSSSILILLQQDHAKFIRLFGLNSDFVTLVVLISVKINT